jgi:purine-binding chemotaxis protein CheW
MSSPPAKRLYVAFQVADARYVLPASDVLHLDAYEGATRVPGTPQHVAGLVQIRQRVVPVVDLRTRFGLPPVPREVGARVVVVEHAGRVVGLLADAAREVLQISEEDFRDPPEVVSEAAEGFVRKVAQAKDRLVMLIDIAKVIGTAPLTPQEPENAH